MKNLLKKLKNKKGFTLAELLIVVAIIAVLVAISIPIFSSQLEKSRDAVSISNIRAAYAQSQTAILTYTDAVDGVAQGDVTVTKATTGGGYTVEVKNVAIKSQKGDDWSGLSVELPWDDADSKPADAGLNKNDATVTFTYDADFKITDVAIA